MPLLKDPDARTRLWLDAICATLFLLAAAASWKASVTPRETPERRAAEQAAARSEEVLADEFVAVRSRG